MSETHMTEQMDPVGMDSPILSDVVIALRKMYADPDNELNGGDVVEALGFLFAPEGTTTDRYWGLLMLEGMAPAQHLGHREVGDV